MSTSGSFVHRTLTALLSDPGQPRLTWYGGDYERIELSGAVLGNWVNKTTNLLVEEFDSEPEQTISLDLPVHWRHLVWSLAALRTGATLDIAPQPSSDNPIDVVITTEPSQFKQANETVAVTLGALARSFAGELPSGAMDAASAVMTYSDGLGYVPATELEEVAITGGPTQVSYADLEEWALQDARNERLLVRCTNNSPAAQMNALRLALGTWSKGGSVVIFGSDMNTEISDDAARLQRIVTSELITDTIEVH